MTGDDELIVGATVLGHASRRWMGAKNPARAYDVNLDPGLRTAAVGA
jgi:hypothetical protein